MFIENFAERDLEGQAILRELSGMTNTQKNWAASHDWFIRATDSGIVALDTCTDQHVEFTCIRKLRVWAGY